MIGIGPGAALVIKEDSGTGTVGRFSIDGCVMVFGGLMLVAVFTDPRVDVVIVSQTVDFIGVCV